MLKAIPKRRLQGEESSRILAALRAGIDPAQLASQIASRHPINPGAARRLVDIASARLWLAKGAPLADVLTMLEVRHRFELSSADCRAYATEILWDALHETHPCKDDPNSTPKEPEYAVA
jgi:hypothetical protein